MTIRQFRTHASTINGGDEVRERDKLFRTAKKSLSKVSKTVNEDELDTLLETLNAIAATLKGKAAANEEDDDEQDDEVEEIDNEDDEDEDEAPQRPPVDKREAVKAMRANSREDSVQRALRNDPRYSGQRGARVENDRKRSSNAVVNAMSDHRGDDAVLRELRRKGR